MIVQLCLFLGYCATLRDIEDPSSIPDENSEVALSETKLKIDFLNLPDCILLLIGECFECPQKTLGFLDWQFYNFFFKTYPYRKILARRHGITEFGTSTSDSDLGVFRQLAFVKDKTHLYNSIHALIYNKNAFNVNKNPIFRFLIRTEN